MVNLEVNLYEYDPKWEDQYTYERKRIIDAIGDKIEGIEHIGSTSIKGLNAKPIIDILVGVKDLSQFSALTEPLSNIDFDFVPKPEFKDRMFFRKGEWGSGTCHLHVCEMGGSEWTEKLLFRDYLRKYREAAEDYAKLKMGLALLYKKDRSTYTQHKAPFIMDIIKKAKEEFK